ncbi:hypothetical protein JTB14_023941 [Gonioctena quinquepunctata]|nr:hypothetical protein JTB14_023941 [Gonioctena quinquepunctata]
MLIFQNDFDVVVITETWLSPDIQDDTVRIQGYGVVRRDRLNRGGSIAIYYKAFLSLEVLENNDSDHTLEQLWVMLRIDFTEAYGMSIMNNEPTRVTEISSTLIDIIAVINKNMVVSIHTRNADDISDHCLVYCLLQYKVNKPQQLFETHRDYKYFVYDDFLDDLRLMPWYVIYQTDDINQIVSLSNTYLLSVFNVHAPVKTVRISKAKAHGLTDTLKIMIKSKNLALSKHKKSKKPEDWNTYKNLRNMVTAATGTEKKNYLIFIQNQQNSKKLWNTLNLLEIVSKKNNKNEIPENLSDPNVINNHFNKSVNDLASAPSNKYEPLNSPQVKFFNISYEDLESIINSIKSNATGTDQISIKMLEICIPFLTPILTYIVNTCFTHGVFPEI